LGLFFILATCFILWSRKT